jgi:hypothetical protein
MKASADAALGTPNLSDQNSNVDVQVLAKALVYARTGVLSYRNDVVSAITTITNNHTEAGSTETLPFCRGLVSYVIAADLVGLDADLNSSFKSYLTFMKTFAATNGATMIGSSDTRPNNQGLHCQASRLAIARYLGDTADVAHVEMTFKGWLGNRASYSGFTYGTDKSWQYDWNGTTSAAPVGINPVGATLVIASASRNVDGVMPDDQRRVCDNGIKANCVGLDNPYHCCTGTGTGSCQYNIAATSTCLSSPPVGTTWPPQRSLYAWGALAPALTVAEMLYNAGVSDIWTYQSSALKRAADWLNNTTFAADGGLSSSTSADDHASGPHAAEFDDEWQPWLLNKRYGTAYACSPVSTHGTDCSPADSGKSIGWTEWTHQ